MFRRASGELQPAKPLLDTLIRISPDDRNGATFLGALCEELQGQTGVKVFAGMFPQMHLPNIIRRQDTRIYLHAKC